MYRQRTPRYRRKSLDPFEWFFNPKVFIGLIILLVIIGVVVNQLVYNDVRCLFAECRIVKK